MIYQDNPRLPSHMQKFACLAFVLARSRETILGMMWSARDLRDAWASAVDAKCITGDLNRDGDVYDDGESEIVDYPGLFALWGLPLRLVSKELKLPVNNGGRVLPVDTPFDPNRYWVAERWFWKIGHFVQGDGTGKQKPVYDPISGGSLTRKNGAIETLRIFEIVRPT
jgi:hypothetical protein